MRRQSQPYFVTWLLAALSLVIAGAEGVCQSRTPVPSAAAQEQAELRVREQFGRELSEADSGGDRTILGVRLLRQAREADVDPAVRYVLLMLARDMFVGAGDASTALSAMRDVAAQYEVDDLALEQAVLQRSSAHQDVDKAFLVEEALILVDRAMDQDRFEIVVDTFVLAREAGLAGDRLDATLDEVQSRRAAHQAVADALEGLAANPEDAESNLRVGEYRCFTQGRWEEGLPLLAKGTDDALKAIAAADLAMARDPQAQESWEVVANGWWEIGTKRPDHARVIQGRAIRYYRQFGEDGRRGAMTRKRTFDEAAKLVATATALKDQGFPRYAAHWLRKATYLDPSTVEDAIAMWTESPLAEEPVPDEEVARTEEPVGVPAREVPPDPPGFRVPDVYTARADGRSKAPPASGAAISAGLEWLQRHQDDDGMWDADEFMKHDRDGVPSDGAGSAVHDVGVTGLALLAFLGDGSTTRSGPYRIEVSKATTWLQIQQSTTGMFGTSASHDFIYDHAIATVAMCEAFAMTGDGSLLASAQAAIDYLEFHRNPARVWRYQPGAGQNDSTVTGWCVLAYKTAQLAGLQINPTAMTNAREWYDDVTDEAGQVGYTKVTELSSRHPGMHATRFPPDKGEALTAIGLSTRFLLGQTPARNPVMVASSQRILEKPPVWDEAGGTIDHYYWLHATNALRQMGGNRWRSWSRQLAAAVLGNQRTDGHFAGSWDPIGVWGEDGGRVYSTAMLVLCLEGEYRYGDALDAAVPQVRNRPAGTGFNRTLNPLRQAASDNDYPAIARALRNLESKDLTEQERNELEKGKVLLLTVIDTAMAEISNLLANAGPDGASLRLQQISRTFKGLPPDREADAGRELLRLLERYPPENLGPHKRALERFVRRRQDTLAGKNAQDRLDKLKSGA